MIAITGAAGFIASNVAALFNRCGRSDLVIVDDFSNVAKQRNWQSLSYALQVDRREFPQWLESHHSEVECLVHLGARTDTTEFDWSVFEELNLGYTKQMWDICTRHAIATASTS